jgi:hypothetical protein
LDEQREGAQELAFGVRGERGVRDGEGGGGGWGGRGEGGHGERVRWWVEMWRWRCEIGMGWVVDSGV